MSTITLPGGRYRLEEQIAAGGMGEVWRAVDRVLARPVAVKLLRADQAERAGTRARFRAEAQRAGSLSHPAIAQIYDYREADPPHPAYLVMELIDGPSLAEVLAAGPLDPGRAMDVLAQAAAGLHAAHLAGLVHRDIKAANLLLDQHGHVKITDFGIAHAMGSAPVTRSGLVAGTPAYLAPERVGGAQATPASDLYALGIVAFECLTGHPPFAGTPLEVAAAHRDRPLPPLPGTIPATVAALVAELTAKDPAARPRSAGEVASRAARLRDAGMGGVTVPLRPEPGALTPTLTEIPLPDPPPVHPLRRLPGHYRPTAWAAALAVAAALAAVLLGLLAGGVLTGTAAPPPSPSPSAGLVDVNGDSLIGQPVSSASQQLSRLGLVVRVVWRATRQEPVATVVSVQPSGQVQVGTVVVVTGALRPHGADQGEGNGNGHGGGDNGGGNSGG